MNKEVLKLNVIPLFPSPLGIIDIIEDCSNLKKIITNYDFEPTTGSTSKACFITKDLNILESFPKEKNIILNYFEIYKNYVLKLDNQKFKMTTSWGTKTEPGGYSQFHNHQNCTYSGVFYFDEMSGGNIEFESYGIYPQQILLNNPTEWNTFNSKSWMLTSKKNMLLLFPSYLYHRITENTSLKNRYSLAFNFFPIESFGVKDSFINISL